MISSRRLSLVLCFLFASFGLLSQSKRRTAKDANPVYVDRQGVMRWTSTNEEAAFFGVNYTTPFAHAYRAQKALGADLEKSITDDVYHMARLGFDAFRVHVWDNEISDIDGNLLDNEHLRLFDFLLAELKKRNIKTLITPIAFWGNGYPERDQDVPGFSAFYGRGKLTTSDSAIVAQENFLKQFFSHINPYTRLAYKDDPDVIAMEINNEPAHSGPKKGVTDYINRLAAAVRSTGWSKPVFYNISQGPYYADAVAAAEINGVSFQWYPSGLVSGRTLTGNYLPHVDKYTIPFDTIPGFGNKARMVYEFDAADILQPVMYPFMAKSFREAGFQWATQFAYDPLAIAHVNTEYQTHYLNLAYTPAKAISMLIASRIFHRLPRLKDYGRYPADTTFDAFRVSHRESLSEMNTDEEFFYSNNTATTPKDPRRLRHIAGVGSSSVVTYSGSGAYFLDKVEAGIWRLEVMPDAIMLSDPYAKPSPAKEVCRLEWRENRMQILLPELGNDFVVNGLNTGNTTKIIHGDGGIVIKPGTYMLVAKGKKFSGKETKIGAFRLNEFVAPQPAARELNLFHRPVTEVSSGKMVTINATVVGLDSGSVSLWINRIGGQSKTIVMDKVNNTHVYEAHIPAELMVPGKLNYKILVRTNEESVSFPGKIKDPLAWSNLSDETWSTFVAHESGAISLFDVNSQGSYSIYPTWTRGYRTDYVTGEEPGQLILRMSADKLSTSDVMGFQFSTLEKWEGRRSELSKFDLITIKAKGQEKESVKGTVTLIDHNGSAMSASFDLTDTFRNFDLPIRNFTPSTAMLMPRPYPAFLPLTFRGPVTKGVDLSTIEKIEVTFTSRKNTSGSCSVEIQYIRAKKSYLDPTN